MFYSGIALAALGCLLLIMQIMGMKKQKKLAEEAAQISDVAPVTVVSSGKANKDLTSIQKTDAYGDTVKMQNVQIDIDDRTVKLSSIEDAAEGGVKPGSINCDNENVGSLREDQGKSERML